MKFYHCFFIINVNRDGFEGVDVLFGLVAVSVSDIQDVTPAGTPSPVPSEGVVRGGSSAGGINNIQYKGFFVDSSRTYLSS